jgi:hypothetical protein
MVEQNIHPNMADGVKSGGEASREMRKAGAVAGKQHQGSGQHRRSWAPLLRRTKQKPRGKGIMSPEGDRKKHASGDVIWWENKRNVGSELNSSKGKSA